jgi:tetratricopeptide (TPR) repeat protein
MIHRSRKRLPAMSRPSRRPALDRIYESYLKHERTARFIGDVSNHYTTATIARLLQTGDRMTRRAAALALGFLGSEEVNHALGMALHDEDRGVRFLAENALREAWLRVGTEDQRRRLRVVIRYCQSGRYHEAIDEATKLCEEAPKNAEVWNQRAIAWYQLKEYKKSAHDCMQALERNPYHFGAAVGLAHCCLELNDGFAAIDHLRRAVSLNPNMDGVQAQLEFLERSLES